MPGNWDDVFQTVQGQGKSPSSNDPKSPSDAYFAYLDKADWDATSNNWFLMFDMVPAEAALLGLKGDDNGDMAPPPLPTILFHAHGVTKDAVYAALQLSGSDEPAEGSWYALYLQQGGDPQTDLVGDLYHPDLDFTPTRPDYKQWSVAAALLIALPSADKSGPLLVPPPSEHRRRQTEAVGAKATPRTFKGVAGLRVQKANRFKPWRKQRPIRYRRIVVIQPPPPPPPGLGALGVMSIGQGGFNLFLDRGTREPLFYYDAGYPLFFFLSSVPAQMRTTDPGYLGPIMQNTAGSLDVILSHWDWDHWRFGAFTNGAGQSLGQLQWTVPFQAMGPSAVNFLAGINAVVIPAGTPPQALANGVLLFKMQAPPGALPAFVINNSGLALRAPVDIAGTQSAGTLLTGDGNFNLLPMIATAGLHVIGAVHHGSNNHGAAAAIPAAPGGTTGRIAYSYGITAGGAHAYGFPNAFAVAAYRLANWNAPTEEATAEGPNINVGPTARGNIRVGDQGALPVAYAGTAFAAIGYALP